jgi:hypothetical protein
MKRAIGLSLAASAGLATVGLLAGCSHGGSSSAPPPASPASPAATTATASAAASTFQPYVLVNQPPPKPSAPVTHKCRTLTVTHYQGKVYLADQEGHYYQAGRDSAGRLCPVYDDPVTHQYYPLYYDQERDKYYRVLHEDNGDTYACYVGDPDNTFYRCDQDASYYDDPYSPPAQCQPIIQNYYGYYGHEGSGYEDETCYPGRPLPPPPPHYHHNDDEWLIAIPVIVGAYLFLSNHHSQPNHYNGPPAPSGYYQGYGNGPGHEQHGSNGTNINNITNITNRNITIVDNNQHGTYVASVGPPPQAVAKDVRLGIMPHLIAQGHTGAAPGGGRPGMAGGGHVGPAPHPQTATQTMSMQHGRPGQAAPNTHPITQTGQAAGPAHAGSHEEHPSAGPAYPAGQHGPAAHAGAHPMTAAGPHGVQQGGQHQAMKHATAVAAVAAVAHHQAAHAQQAVGNKSRPQAHVTRQPAVGPAHAQHATAKPRHASSPVASHPSSPARPSGRKAMQTRPAPRVQHASAPARPFVRPQQTRPHASAPARPFVRPQQTRPHASTPARPFSRPQQTQHTQSAPSRPTQTPRPAQAPRPQMQPQQTQHHASAPRSNGPSGSQHAPHFNAPRPQSFNPSQGGGSHMNRPAPQQRSAPRPNNPGSGGHGAPQGPQGHPSAPHSSPPPHQQSHGGQNPGQSHQGGNDNHKDHH